MRVERQVVRIERAVALNECGHARIGRTGERPGHVPVHPVVDDQEVHAGGDRVPEGDETGVDRGADTRDSAVVGDLQAVEGSGRILEPREAGALVAVGDEVV